ncbi:hypothetical protein SCHPADRAFT_838981 [Schizopora paradoxa]|uniref:Uncharacterized protein n=1 Tax=Schizopora paradoxa TaxID=27342 RepID=A0A0H2R1S8_9AGAM|nr:hypothetical protein SCHPADRAFT_838981 [Schizopora paradoxa]
MVWDLLAKMKAEDNRKVLFGKKTGENSSRNNKMDVYKRIAQELLPDIWAVSETTAADRIKNKIERISGDITKKFPFFPKLHELCASRPNMIPVAVTTGVGPNGRRTQNYQAPEGANSAAGEEPSEDLPPTQPEFAPASQATFNNGKENMQPMYPPVPSSTPATPTTPGPAGRQPQASSFGSILEKAKSRIPAKRTIEDRLSEMASESMALARKRHDDEQTFKSRQLDIQERELLMKEYKEGLIDRDEYRERLEGMKRQRMENNTGDAQTENSD